MAESDTPVVRLQERPDFWRCQSGELHVWQYLGKVAQAYRCTLCQLRVTKADFKVATDA